ncbi:MAG: M15 family metallopeptidase [Bianqueaceae bacterium]
MFYDTRNRNNLDKLADSTRKAAYEWYQYLLDTDTEVLIYDTLRTKQQQEENVQNGVSQTMRSYHLVGQALDFVPVVDSKGSVDWNGYARAEIRRAIERAKNLGFTWGGDWTSFADQPHLQYDGIGYGTDTFNRGDTVSTPSNTTIIRQIQETLNARYGTQLTVDGRYGPATKRR